MKAVFKIYDYRILLGGITIWFILIFIPNGIIPDYLNLGKVIESKGMPKIILAFSSFFGFLISVLILTYGLLREKFRRLTLREFLENKYSIFLISSFITIFLINIFSSVYLDIQNLSHSTLNITYYSLILSVSFFLLSLPIAFISISYTDSQDLIDKYLKTLNINHFPKYRAHHLSTTHDEKNPIVVLMNLVRAYSEKDDFHSIITIIFCTQIKIQNLIANSQDREIIGRLLSGQKLIWETVLHKSFQKKEYDIINNIFHANRFYHLHFSKNGIPLLFLEEIDFFIKGVIEKLVKENLIENIDQVILSYEEILELHYKNSCPSEDKIKELKRFFNKSSSQEKDEFILPNSHQTIYINLQWQKIHSDIPYVFSIILSQALENNNIVIFKRALGSLQHLIHVAYHSDLGDYQKAWIIRLFVNNLHYYQIKALKKGLLNETIELKTLNDGLILTEIIDNDFFYMKEILVSISAFLLDIYALDKLNLQTINILGSIGRHCSNKYLELNSCKETLNYIIKVIKHLKNLFEQDLSKNSNNYEELKNEIDSFIEFHKMPSLTTWQPNKPSPKRKIDSNLVDMLEDLKREFKDLKITESIKKVEWA